MLLTEIFGPLFEKVSRKLGSIPVIKTDSDPRSTDRTQKRADHHLGTGAQTSAYNHKNGIVKYTDLNGEDDPVVKYINISMYNQHNPYLPKYSSAKVYEDGQGYLTMVSVCERLTGDIMAHNIEKDPARIEFLRAMPLTSAGQAEINRILAKIGEEFDSGEGDDEKLARAYGQLMVNVKSKKELQALKYFFNDKDFLKAIDIISAFDEKDFDMHSGNFMWRNDGHLVILDPVYGKPNAMHKKRASRTPKTNAFDKMKSDNMKLIDDMDTIVHSMLMGVHSGDKFKEDSIEELREVGKMISAKIKEFGERNGMASKPNELKRVNTDVKMFTKELKSKIKRATI